ncbi:MAG: lipocalin-like domain-containing protein [Bacteroidaceae bacterium]
MRRVMRCMAMLMLAMAGSLQADAQLKNLLKNVAGEAVNSATGNSTAGDVLGGLASKLLGTDKLNADNLQGTWTYSEPCVAFESESLLTSVGSSLASKKVETTLAKQMTRLGFTAGKMTLALNADSTGTVNLNGKDVKVTWSVSETDLILTFPLTKKSVHMNAKLSGNSLQLAMSTDKLLTLATAITEKASTVNSTLGTVNSLMKNIKGMYVGLKFTK